MLGVAAVSSLRTLAAVKSEISFSGCVIFKIVCINSCPENRRTSVIVQRIHSTSNCTLINNSVINIPFVQCCFCRCARLRRHMRELYLFTHVDGLCRRVGHRQRSQSLSTAAALPCCVTPTMPFFVPPPGFWLGWV